MQRTKGEKIFECFNLFFMIIVCTLTLYPVWYVFVASFSSGDAITSGKVTFLIKDFTIEAYRQVFRTKNIWTAYGNTVFYAVVGTAVSMFLTVTGGYVLSKKRLRGRKIITILVLFVMWFSPGMMPQYLNLRMLGLLDTRLGIILFGAVTGFYVVLMRTFFEAIPEAMEESAKLDGASDYLVLTQIYLPLSVAAIMTLTLYYFVGRWNAYFWSMLILKDETKIPLQVLLKKLVVEMTANNSELGNVDYTRTSRETTIYATIMVAVLPMIAIYPFVQKYFVKGIMVGAVKG